MGNKLETKKQDIAKTSSIKLLKIYSPKNCMAHSGKVRTIQDAMNADTLSIGALQRQNGRKFSEALIKAWLVYLNDILNLNKPMTEDQIEMCAIEIVNEYYAMKFSDLTLLFKRIIAGEFGEFYESLSIPKVLSFFRNYYDERCNLAMEQSQREHSDRMSEETFNIFKNVKRILRSN